MSGEAGRGDVAGRGCLCSARATRSSWSRRDASSQSAPGLPPAPNGDANLGCRTDSRRTSSCSSPWRDWLSWPSSRPVGCRATAAATSRTQRRSLASAESPRFASATLAYSRARGSQNGSQNGWRPLTERSVKVLGSGVCVPARKRVTGYGDVSRPRKSALCRPSSPAAGALPTGHAAEHVTSLMTPPGALRTL